MEQLIPGALSEWRVIRPMRVRDPPMRWGDIIGKRAIISPRSSIALYRITAKLGEGGTGEVWRATDIKLNRDVAIKILPNHFAQDSVRMGRFHNEARVLASLNSSEHRCHLRSGGVRSGIGVGARSDAGRAHRTRVDSAR
jgi:serine/threonine protein kinase